MHGKWREIFKKNGDAVKFFGSGSNLLVSPMNPIRKKSERIDIIVEKIAKTNQNPGRDDIINRSDPLSTFPFPQRTQRISQRTQRIFQFCMHGKWREVFKKKWRCYSF